MCGQQRNSPMADPIFGSKYGPQNGVQNWITFSFLLLGLCLGPVLGSRFGPKSGVSHRRILLLPAEVLQADLRRTSMSVSVNTCFFSLCVPLCFLYSSVNLLTRATPPFHSNLEPNGTSLCMEELGDGFSFVFVVFGVFGCCLTHVLGT